MKSRLINVLATAVLCVSCGAGNYQQTHSEHMHNTQNKKNKESVTMKPNRVKHSYTQTIHAAPDKVFSLLCPEEEKYWAPGWDTEYIISYSGKAEADCIFKTNLHGRDSIWIITMYKPESHYLEMLKVTPGYTVCKLCIKLDGTDDNSTHADISYEYTSLSASGDAFLRSFTKEYYENFMKHWENAMNHYLETGKMISSHT